ncbi:MAG: hypothetical protein R6V45_06550 [Oceanipulchritudo sp.]
MNAARLRIVLFSVSILFLAGCATRYPVRVDALSEGGGKPGGTEARYILKNASPGSEDTDLFFKEISRHLNPVLQQAGFRKAEERGEANQVIDVKAYLSEPMVETRSHSEPIYAHTGGYSRVIRIPIVNDKGEVVSYNYSSYWTPSRTRVAGYVDRDRQYTVYDKILELSARRLNEEGERGEEIWTVSIALRSASTDYRSALPYMLVAAEPYIGQRTDGEEIIRIPEDDPDVEAFRRQLDNAR